MKPNILIHHGVTETPRKARMGLTVRAFSVPPSLRGEMVLVSIRIPQVSFYRKVFAEAMQLHMLYLGSLRHLLESGAGREGNRSGTGQDFRSVIKKDFVDDIRRQRGPIHGRAAFDH